MTPLPPDTAATIRTLPPAPLTAGAGPVETALLLL